MTDEQKERMRMLVADLRAHPELQTRGALQRLTASTTREPGFCCLGRACALSQLGEWENEGAFAVYLGVVDYLPREVEQWYGFTSNHGFWLKTKGDEKASCATLNDEGFSFSQIADLIEWEYAL